MPKTMHIGSKEIQTTVFLGEVEMKDPITGDEITLEIHRVPGGGVFAVDAEFLDQAAGPDELHDLEADGCYSPFDEGVILRCQDPPMSALTKSQMVEIRY